MEVLVNNLDQVSGFRNSVFRLAAAAACLVAFSGTLTAIAATPQEIATTRDENFDEIGKNMKILLGAAKAGVVDDSTIAAAAKISELSKALPGWFVKGSGPTDPGVTKTRALAEVWTKPEDFAAKVKAFQEAVAALQPATATKDMAQFGPAIKATADACKGCHDTFKKPKDK